MFVGFSNPNPRVLVHSQRTQSPTVLRILCFYVLIAYVAGPSHRVFCRTLLPRCMAARRLLFFGRPSPADLAIFHAFPFVRGVHLARAKPLPYNLPRYG
jgi:hypothetical protein